MRFKLLAIVALLSLAVDYQASAQQPTPADGWSATTASTADTANLAGTAAGERPEQASDLYRTRTHADGDAGPSAKQDDPIAGALNPPTEPLATDRLANTKE